MKDTDNYRLTCINFFCGLYLYAREAAMSRHLYRFFALAFSCGFISSGCAIHPLPENVTGVSTTHIVHRIRCEARDAVLDAARIVTPAELQGLKSIAIV